MPPALRDHLFDRLRERKITAEDLNQLKAWRESNPDAPDGLWYKDFGSFKICGDGKYPKTFCLRAKQPKGRNSDVLGAGSVDVEHALRRWSATDSDRGHQGFSNSTRNNLPRSPSGGQRDIVVRCRKPARVTSVTTIDVGMP